VNTSTSTGIFVDSSVLLNVLYETELTRFAENVLNGREILVTSETVLDECVYVHLRKMAAEEGVRNIYDLRKTVKTETGKNLLCRAVDEALELVGSYEILVLRDPEIYAVLSTAKEYGLLPHDAKIAATILSNGIRKIATFDRDFSNIPGIEPLPEDYWENKLQST